MRAPTAAAVVAFLFCAAPTAFAVPITYTYAGFGDGTLGQSTFANQAFTISASADTDNITPWVNASEGPQNTHISTTISIVGLGSFTIHTPSHTWLSEGCCGGLGADLGPNWITVTEAEWLNVGYGLDTNLAPVSSDSLRDVVQFGAVLTSGGWLSFSSIPSITFSAALAPLAVAEPGVVSLVCMGLLGLTLGRRRPKGIHPKQAAEKAADGCDARR